MNRPNRVSRICCWFLLLVSISSFASIAAAEKKTSSKMKPLKYVPSPLKDVRLNDPRSPFQFTLALEAGFTGIADHVVQFGKSGTEFNYVKDGGQDNLYLFLRLSFEMMIQKRHHFVFLYQPLDIRTQTILRDRLVQDQATFEAGEAVDFRYGFDFYRISYLYDFLETPKHELSFGLSLRIRNATIVFSNVSGTKRSYRNDVGPVPILKSRGNFSLPHQLFFGFEVDGFYAPIAYLNGSNSDVEGAILDASLRFGRRVLPLMDLYFNIRYLGGGGVGTSSNANEPNTDGYTLNWLHTFIFSLGVRVH